MTPAELPAQQDLPCAWYGPQMSASPHDWTLALSQADCREIRTALDAWLARQAVQRSPAPLTAADFALPTLGPRLAQLRHELLHGRGFFLLTGMPVGHWSQRDVALAFIGLGAHLGNARSQNAAGHLLGHVRDLGLASTDPNVRLYQTHERQTFHTESCDVVGLLCINEAQQGGDSLLVSSTTIYNEMRRRRPDLAALLFEPLATDRRGEVPIGMKPWFDIPVFSWHDGSLSALYQRQYIDSAQRFEQVPRLTAAKVEALNLFDSLANDPSLNFTMRLAPGDMQFVHNHNLLHDRSGFTDWPDDARRRHLLRLWLAVPGARALPPVFAQRYGSVTVGDRGGIVVPGTTPCVPLDEGLERMGTILPRRKN
jgi:hypothetical protein